MTYRFDYYMPYSGEDFDFARREGASHPQIVCRAAIAKITKTRPHKLAGFYVSNEPLDGYYMAKVDRWYTEAKAFVELTIADFKRTLDKDFVGELVNSPILYFKPIKVSRFAPWHNR